MEKVISYLEFKRKHTHIFSCDKCEEVLGNSIEYEDGYYDEIGVFESEIYIDGLGWLKLKATLCDKCKAKFIKELEKEFNKLGFLKEE